MSDKTLTHIIRLIFVLNALFFIWAILWKCGVPYIGDGTQRIINLAPFRGNTGWEMQFNVLLFVPLGFLFSSLATKKLPWRFLGVLFASAILEIAQYILAVGRSDITDILLNTLGGIIGISAFYLLTKLFGKHSRKAVMFACLLIAAFEIYVSVSLILFGVVHLGFMMLRM